MGNQEKLASGQEATEIMIIFGLSQIKMKYVALLQVVFRPHPVADAECGAGV